MTGDGAVELLTDEADGLKFKLTDGVDVAQDGMIYFTDASYKYTLHEFLWDILEGRPHGRFMSFDPLTKETKVLVPHLYFANGVAVSQDQTFVIFCETVMYVFHLILLCLFSLEIGYILFHFFFPQKNK